MVQVLDKQFRVLLSGQQVEERIATLGAQISASYEGKEPLFISVLNGSFMFSAELMKHISIPSSITFVKVASYHATESTGEIEEILGLEYDVAGRHIIVLEDIIESGLTVHSIFESLKVFHPASVSVACLLHKPATLKKALDINYIGFEIGNEFVVGYGLDYNGFGRNLYGIYQLAE